MTDLFVYGTLRSSALLEAVSGRDDLLVTPATLVDYQVGSVAGDVVPFIRPSEGSIAEGALISAFPVQAMERLDAYEGAFGYQLIEVRVKTGDGIKPAKMYLPPDSIQDAEQDWSLSYWSRNWERMAVHAATELFRHDPPFTAQQIRAQWKMIEGRAWSKELAQAPVSDLQMRREPETGAVVPEFQRAPTGDFFRFEKIAVTAKRFDGTTSDNMQREGIIGFDAAFVLPYDPKRDVVLLVEQLRIGPILRHDPQPWLLEPIAGLIDPRESPEESARREAVEEAHLGDLDLHPVVKAYASPGNSTDFFHMFVGLCDLGDDHPRYGGVEGEGEDIRLHIIPRTQALELIQTGEINVIPLITMLMWLELNRKRLVANG